MRVLVIDIRGTSLKILATAQGTPSSFPPGTTLTPTKAVGWQLAGGFRQCKEDR